MPAGCGVFGDNVWVVGVGRDYLYKNDGFSSSYFEQIVVENAENNLDEDNLYRTIAFRRVFCVQIVRTEPVLVLQCILFDPR